MLAVFDPDSSVTALRTSVQAFISHMCTVSRTPCQQSSIQNKAAGPSGSNYSSHDRSILPDIHPFILLHCLVVQSWLYIPLLHRNECTYAARDRLLSTEIPLFLPMKEALVPRPVGAKPTVPWFPSGPLKSRRDRLTR